VFNVGNWRIGVFGVLGPQTLPEGIKVGEVKKAVEESIANLKELKVDKIILLSHLGLEEDRKIAKISGIDIIVGSHSLDALAQPEKVDNTLIVQPLNQGQQIGTMDFNSYGTLKAQSVIDMDKAWDAQNDLQREVDTYKKRVKELGLIDSKDKTLFHSTNKNPFVANPATCQGCHQKQYDFWLGTKHASAYLALFAKDQHFNPECISCHSLGFQEPGGFNKIAEPVLLKGVPKRKKGQEPFIEQWTKAVMGDELAKGDLDSRLQPERFEKIHSNYKSAFTKLVDSEKIIKWNVGVQCEHCHGNRNGHPNPKVKTVKAVSEDTCLNCHRAPNAKPLEAGAIARIACPLSSK
jgi:hypothetical protein